MPTCRWSRSVVIHLPVEEVFDFLAAGYFENRPRYVPLAEGTVKTSEGPVGVGTTGRWSAPHPAGGSTELNFIFTEFVPNRKTAIRSTNSYHPKDSDIEGTAKKRKYATLQTFGTSIYQPITNGTRLTTQSQMWFTGVNSF